MFAETVHEEPLHRDSSLCFLAQQASERSRSVPERFAQAVREAVSAGELDVHAAMEASACSGGPCPGVPCTGGEQDLGSVGRASGIPAMHDLCSAAHAARTARNSLRQLVAALASTSGTLQEQSARFGNGHKQEGGTAESLVSVSSIVDAMRAKVHQDIAKLKIHRASAMLRHLPYEDLRTARAPGVPPRRQSSQAKQDVPCDLTPRLRLQAGAQKFVRAVALSTSNPGGCSREGECVALVLDEGFVEIWEQDSFNWHLAAKAQVPPPHLPCASAAFSLDGLNLWLVLSDPVVEDASARASARVVLFARISMGPLEMVAAAAPLPGIRISGPVPLQEADGNNVVAAAFHLVSCASSSRMTTSSEVHTFMWRRRASALVPVAVRTTGERPRIDAFAQVVCFEVGWQKLVAVPHAAIPVVAGLWSLPTIVPGQQNQAGARANRDTASEGKRTFAERWRLAIWVRERARERGGASELQVRSGAGQCLAVLPLEPGVACLSVPSQGHCPVEMLSRLCIAADPPPFVVLTERLKSGGSHPAECIVSIAAVDATAIAASIETGTTVGCGTAHIASAATTAHKVYLLQMRPLYSMGMPSVDIEVVSFCEGLLGCRSTATTYVVDWQHLCTHRLPQGWLPLAVGPTTIVALLPRRPEVGSELVFLEPY